MARPRKDANSTVRDKLLDLDRREREIQQERRRLADQRKIEIGDAFVKAGLIGISDDQLSSVVEYAKGLIEGTPTPNA